jgi:hypothetical protein
MDESTIKIVCAVLSSSLLSGFISNYVSNRQFKKEVRLKRITDERTKWRENIREIVKELSELDLNKQEDILKLRRILNQLKVRINIYGVNKPDSILKDNHIWNKINEISESAIPTYEQIDCLIMYLSALLKYDWERAKIEAGYKISCKDKKEIKQNRKKLKSKDYIDIQYEMFVKELTRKENSNEKSN